MTLIKPVKGLDDAMAEGFASIVGADPLKTLQVVIAMESADDPAFDVATAFRSAHLDRDITVLVTGPAGRRMGKAHNMIAAAARAKNDVLLFSDADTIMSRELLADAARAFDEGAGAVYGMPYHARAVDAGSWWFMLAFNHTFCIPGALTHELGQLRTFAGAFMGYTRAALDKVGGLAVIGHKIADDFSLGLTARAAGVRQELLRVPVLVSETGTRPVQAFTHLAKWMSIIFWTYPAGWATLPLFNASILAGAAIVLAAASGESQAFAYAALTVALVSRVIVAWLQDRLLADYRLPFASYWRLLLADAGALILWPLGLRRVVQWRGRRYRLFFGGDCEVLE